MRTVAKVFMPNFEGKKFRFRKELLCLANQLYILMLREYFDWITVSELQRKIEGREEQSDEKYREKYSRRLYKNIRGYRIKDLNFLNRAEQLVPGSKQILETPLWRVLEYPNSSLEEVHQLMRSLPPDISNNLFEFNGVLTRKELKRKAQLRRIVMQGTLDSLACLLLITREMELQGRLDPYIEAKWAVHQSLQMLCTTSSFILVNQYLYPVIYELFLGKNNPLPESLRKPIIEMKPSAFEGPVYHRSFNKDYDLNVTILWYAQRHKLIGDSKKEQKRFLYYCISESNRFVIEQELKELPHHFKYKGDNNSLPEALRHLMHFHTSDQRKVMSNEGFLD